jgi:hypothetical protein
VISRSDYNALEPDEKQNYSVTSGKVSISNGNASVSWKDSSGGSQTTTLNGTFEHTSFAE